MKDDILKFRKVCNILKENGWKLPQIIKEVGVSEPTYYKLINTEIGELKIQASVLGLVQDFIKKHVDDVNYAGIITPSVVGATSPPPGEKIRRPAREKKIASSQAPRNDEAKEPALAIEPKNTDDFIKFMRKLTAEIPSNLKIKITING